MPTRYEPVPTRHTFTVTIELAANVTLPIDTPGGIIQTREELAAAILAERIGPDEDYEAYGYPAYTIW